MAKRVQDGTWIGLYMELDTPIVRRLDQQAVKNRRSRTAELMVILDGVLPPLADDAEPVPAKRPRGKPGPKAKKKES